MVKTLLKDVIKTNTNSYQKIDNWEYINYLDTGNLTENNISEIVLFKPSIDKIPSRAKRKVKVGDILYSTVRPNQKHYGYIDKEYDNLLVSTGYIVIEPNNKIINGKYLYYYLTQDKIVNYLQTIAENTVATYPSISPKDIEDLVVDLPSLQNQNKMASILSNYDKLIENNNKWIKILEELAQKIYKEWFVDFKFPNHETATFKQTDLGKIPNNWEIKQIGKEYKTYLGGTPSRNEEKYWNGKIPWLNSGKTNELRITKASEYVTELGLEKSSTKLMPQYTTVLAITGATLGQVSMLGSEMCANQSVVGIYSDKNPEYVFYLMKDKIQKLIQSASGGAQQHINKDIVNEMKFVLPADTMLNDFKDIIRPINKEIFNLLYKNHTLKQTRDLLLPRLISGKIDVEKLEIL